MSRKQNCVWRTKIFESKTPDFPIAIFIDENGLSFDVADSQSFAALVLVDLCIALGQQPHGRKYEALNQWSWLLDAAREDTAALVQLIMDRLKNYGIA